MKTPPSYRKVNYAVTVKINMPMSSGSQGWVEPVYMDSFGNKDVVMAQENA